jgi:cobyrinic acid a,c-diamide synthase
MSAPGLIIAAPSSRAGKTTVALGLMRALMRRGHRVRGLKSGPDYIDPGFHRAATGAVSYNLDSFAMPPALLDSIVAHAAEDKDILIVEGAMGLFDGLRGEAGRRGAAADLARRYGWPVVLVIDCAAVAQSAAAVALGLATYDPQVRVAGVVLNRLASERHRASVEDGFARLDLPVLGALPRTDAISLPERHLGLVQHEELAGAEPLLDALADLVERHCDVPAIAAKAGGNLPHATQKIAALPPPDECIAIARDAAFSFLYPHVVEGWQARGAELRYFSPLANEPPPADCDACYLPGGYPELHAGRIASARHFLSGLRTFAKTKPVHGECGGYMVLGEVLIGADGARHPMAGLLPVTTSFAARRLQLGYRRANLVADTAFGQAGSVLRGHEFHYATLVSAAPGEGDAFARLADGEGRDLGPAGHRAGTVSGAFFHAISLTGSEAVDAAQ